MQYVTDSVSVQGSSDGRKVKGKSGDGTPGSLATLSSGRRMNRPQGAFSMGEGKGIGMVEAAKTLWSLFPSLVLLRRALLLPF